MQIAQVIFNSGYIFVMGVYIGSHEYFSSIFLCELNALSHFLETEIVRIGTKPVFLTPDIDGIGPIMNGKF
ncbi:hypothetical protein D3C81_949720 [compost metagenome]